MNAAAEIARQIAVLALLAAAAALATPPGRLPLAFRSLARALGRPAESGAGRPRTVSRRRRTAALALAAAAVALGVWR